jgi:hypothetical protein
MKIDDFAAIKENSTHVLKTATKGLKDKEKCLVSNDLNCRQQSIKEPTAKGWIAGGKFEDTESG